MEEMKFSRELCPQIMKALAIKQYVKGKFYVKIIK